MAQTALTSKTKTLDSPYVKSPSDDRTPGEIAFDALYRLIDRKLNSDDLKERARVRRLAGIDTENLETHVSSDVNARK